MINLGANDVDVFQQELSERDQHVNDRDIFWRKADRDMHDFFNYLKIKVLAVMRFLRNNLPCTQFLYVKINPRPWWGEHARRLARWLDYFVIATLRRRYNIRVKDIWIREVYKDHSCLGNEVMPGMMKTDMVHLNAFGNRGFVSAIMRPLLAMWVSKVNEYNRLMGLPLY